MFKPVFSIILVTFLSLSLFNSHASTAFEVEGVLEQVPVEGPEEFGLKILTPEGELEISELQAKFRFCDEGVYLVVNNIYPENTYTLLDIIKCYSEDED